jgi:hypothetical protein
LSLGERKNFNVCVEAGLVYSALTYNPNIGNKTIENALNANIDLGMNCFFTSDWAVIFELSNILSSFNANPENDNNSSDLNINVNLFKKIFLQSQFGLLNNW